MPPPPDVSPVQIDGELGPAWRDAVVRFCPRLAALPRGGSAQARRLAIELARVECLDRLCEHPEKLDAESRAASDRLKPACERMRSLLGGGMDTMAESYRQAFARLQGARQPLETLARGSEEALQNRWEMAKRPGSA